MFCVRVCVNLSQSECVSEQTAAHSIFHLRARATFSRHMAHKCNDKCQPVHNYRIKIPPRCIVISQTFLFKSAGSRSKAEFIFGAAMLFLCAVDMLHG